MTTEKSSLHYVFQLIDRGIPNEKIDQAMKKMLGTDWREIGVSEWFSRLKLRGYLDHDTPELSADDLEALVQASIKLDSL